eukprot:TRINITY_DN14441_c0_g3_i3.p1 TRINITY_DN14441_c0_g3~~TRINITY_DN14441_c0_g3_i3.p1  ORF type:complete len:257 (-),score=49.12 TRINITY_DN14441_c0_g3_i3:180-950(-)
MEHLAGDDLQGLLQRSSAGRIVEEVLAARLMRQLLEALRWCHECGVAHRDVKAENVLLRAVGEEEDRGLTCRLIDFGLSAEFAAACEGSGDSLSNQPWSKAVGTPDYWAPEMLSRLGRPPVAYGPQVDVWAVGVLAFLLLTGGLPFGSVEDNGGRPAKVFAQVKRYADLDDIDSHHDFLMKASPPDLWQGLSQEARVFVAALLTPCPLARPSAAQALQHPWLQEAPAKVSSDEETVAPSKACSGSSATPRERRGGA